MLFLILLSTVTFAGEMLFSSAELLELQQLKSEKYLVLKRREDLRQQALDFFEIIIKNEKMYILKKQKNSDKLFFQTLDYRQLDKSALELFSK